MEGDSEALKLFQPYISVMKMDVEGYEPRVLRGGKNKFFRSAVAPKYVVFETTIAVQNTIKGRKHLEEIYEIMTENGYVAENWGGVQMRSVKYPNGEVKAVPIFQRSRVPQNSVFVKKRSFGKGTVS